MAIVLKDVLADPVSVASHLASSLSKAGSVSVEKSSPDLAVFRLAFFPQGVFAREGFPVEECRVHVFSDGRIFATPSSGPGRPWLHRNLFELCLWYPDDPRELRWEWEDGFEEYVRIVARHLIYEEIHRRTGRWPVEDAPHGRPSIGSWRIRSREMLGSSREGRDGR